MVSVDTGDLLIRDEVVGIADLVRDVVTVTARAR